MSRTGIPGGVRRGSAAAAVGAVLVLSAGVPASQSDEGTPKSGGNSVAAKQDSPGQDGDGKDTGRDTGNGTKDKGAKHPKGAVGPSPVPRRTPAPSALPVPTALVPAVRASLATAAPAATASPSSVASTPLPLPPDVPDIPSATLPPTILPVPSLSSPGTLTEGTAHAAPTRTGGGAPSGTPVPPPESGARAGAPAVEGSDAILSGTGQPHTDLSGVGQQTIPGNAAAQSPAATMDAGANPAGASGAGGSAQSAAAQDAGGRTPQAAGTLPGSRQNVGSYISTQPELEGAMVGLGLGLVGVAAAAGAAYLRMRRP